MAPAQRRRGPPQRRRDGGPSRRAQDAGSSRDVPALSCNPTQRRTLRWVGAVAINSPVLVTRACLLSTIVACAGVDIAATSATLVPIYESVRIRRVRLQFTPASVNSLPTQQLSMEWSSYLGKNTRITKTVMSSLGAVFSLVPPRGSRAAMWSSSNTSANAADSINELLFSIEHDPTYATLTGTTPLLLDIELECVTANDTQASLALTINSGGHGQNAGIYQLPLDILGPSGAVGAMILNPVTDPDFRVSPAMLQISVSAATRTA